MIKEASIESFSAHVENAQSPNNITNHENSKITVFYFVDQSQEGLFSKCNKIEELEDYFEYLKVLDDKLSKRSNITIALNASNSKSEFISK